MIDQRNSSDAPGYPQESLRHAVHAVAYRQIIAFLVLTLAFSAPLSCQQHGMMSVLDMHDAHDHAAGHDGNFPCSFHDHQPTAGMALSTFAGISPSIPALPQAQIPTPLTAEVSPFTLQLDQAPPDQPPRAL